MQVGGQNLQPIGQVESLLPRHKVLLFLHVLDADHGQPLLPEQGDGRVDVFYGIVERLCRDRVYVKERLLHIDHQ